MSATVLYMSMSLDGFIAGPNDTTDNALGDDGHRLHHWILPEGGNKKDLDDIRRSGTVNGGIVEEFMSTGALVIGRRTFEFAGGFAGDHHDGVPVFIVGRKKMDLDISGWPHFTYLDDITEAVSRAKEAAGDKNVMMHGAELVKLALAAGVLDELELHVVPVLMGQGRRLFDGLPAEQIELERMRILAGENGVTHMHFKVIR